MDSNQIVKAGMDAAKTRDLRWLVIDLLFGFADGYVSRPEAEHELTGLVDDPAALLGRVKGGDTDGRYGKTL